MEITRTGLRVNGAVSWPYVYLAIATIGLGVLALKWSNVRLLRDVSGLTLATVLLGVFAITSLVHWWAVSRGNDIGNDVDGRP